MINNESTSESNFYKFINLIVDRKRTIFSFVIILTTLSVIVSLIYPKTYRATATFEIGYFHNGITQNYISDSRNMQERLRAMLIHEGEYGPIKDILLPVNKANGVLFIVSEEGSVEEAVSGIEDAFDIFNQMNTDSIKAIEKSKTLEEQIKTIVYSQYHRQEKINKRKLNEIVTDAILKVKVTLGLQNSPDEQIKAIVFDQYKSQDLLTKESLDGMIRDAILSITTQLGIRTSSENIADSNAEESGNNGFIPPRIIGKIHVVPYPISPNKTAIVVLTFIVSIFLSVMYVLLTNFLVSIKS